MKYFLFLLDSVFALFRSKRSIQKLQLKKLKKMIRHAYGNVPMYRELYRDANVDIASLADLQNLPILSSDFLREQELAFYTSAAVDRKDAILWGTSGSSGTPFQFYQTKEDALKWQMTFLRSLLANGFKPWWRVAAIMRQTTDPAPGLLSRLLTFRKNIVAIGLPVEEQVARLQKLKPHLIYGITPAMEILADWMLENDRCLDSTKMIMGLGISPTQESAERLRSAFGKKTKVISGYGANDVGSIGFYCSRCQRFHFEDDQVITEIVDENNEPVAPGATGRILITTLDRMATPLIRLDIGDYVKMPVEAKKCMIKFKQFEAIAGRETDKIILQGGARIAYVHLWNVTRLLKNVKMLQFYQPREGEVIIKYVPRANAALLEIEKHITDQLPYQDQLHYSFQAVDDIPLEKSGKRKLLKMAERG